MAQTKKKRRRKHSGTQAGTVQRRSAPRKPHTKEDRRAVAKERREERMSRPPSWKSAVARAALAAALFLAIAYFFLGQQPSQVAVATLAAFVVYIPAAYYTDRWRYNRYVAKQPPARGRSRNRH